MSCVAWFRSSQAGIAGITFACSRGATKHVRGIAHCAGSRAVTLSTNLAPATGWCGTPLFSTTMTTLLYAVGKHGRRMGDDRTVRTYFPPGAWLLVPCECVPILPLTLLVCAPAQSATDDSCSVLLACGLCGCVAL
jgi:hypothetical protein